LFKYLKQISTKSDVFKLGRVPMTFAFQKEVCERLVGKPNTEQYSRISILAQYLCDVRLKFVIPGII
jgi:dimethyladenosine transferase 1